MGLGGNVELRSEGIITVLILKSMAGYSPKLGASLLGAFLAWTLLPRSSSDSDTSSPSCSSSRYFCNPDALPVGAPPDTPLAQMLFLL